LTDKVKLLFLGFLLTTVLGGVVGYLMNKRSWQVETEHALHKARYDEGVEFLDELSNMIGRRYYLLQRLLWAIEVRDKDKIYEREQEYFNSVIDWNSSFWRNRNKIRLLANEVQANAFLDYKDDSAGDKPISLHYKFVAAHRAVMEAKESPNLISEARKQVEELNWKSSIFLERLTSEFLKRAIKLQLLEIPSGPGGAERAAPADSG